MIARLRGEVVERAGDRLIVDCGGVGYAVHVSIATMASTAPPGEQVTLAIHTHVTEGAITLFGFAGAEEHALFELLIGVQGIGPRTAVEILSSITPGELGRALAAGDHARLQRLRGVGRKTAERLVVELRDKVAALGALPAAAALGAGPTDPLGALPAAGPLADVVSALVGLGYKPVEAERLAAPLAGREAPIEELLREALRLAAQRGRR